MTNKHGIPARVDIDFEKKVRRLFPEDRSFVKSTRRLIPILGKLDSEKNTRRKLLNNLDEII